MNCTEENCICRRACEILGQCVMQHQLVTPYAASFKTMVVTGDTHRFKKIVRILEALQPTKFEKKHKRIKNNKERKAKTKKILTQLGKGKKKKNFKINPVWN